MIWAVIDGDKPLSTLTKRTEAPRKALPKSIEPLVLDTDPQAAAAIAGALATIEQNIAIIVRELTAQR